MLDFAQMRSGKFRKDLSTFNIQVAIEEIVNIQILKAEHIGIHLTYIMLNFEGDFVICSDMLRIQQVLLNLQSNALKFTPPGGSVLITCKLI